MAFKAQLPAATLRCEQAARLGSGGSRSAAESPENLPDAALRAWYEGLSAREAMTR